MPPVDNSKPKNPAVWVAVVLLVVIAAVDAYLIFSKRSVSVPTPADQNSVSNTAKPALGKTEVYVGYVQEFRNKQNIIDGVEYGYVLGLLNKNGDSIPVWLTEKEYASIKIFDLKNGIRKPISSSDLKSADYLRVTRIVDVANPGQNMVIVEKIN